MLLAESASSAYTRTANGFEVCGPVRTLDHADVRSTSRITLAIRHENQLHGSSKFVFVGCLPLNLWRAMMHEHQVGHGRGIILQLSRCFTCVFNTANRVRDLRHGTEGRGCDTVLFGNRFAA